MSDLPTTEEVRDRYLDEWDYYLDEPNSYRYVTERGDSFDRWLESVKAQASLFVLDELIALARGDDAHGVSSIPVQWIEEIRQRVTDGLA